MASVFEVVVLFFALGVFVRVVKSDLHLPETLFETTTNCLLLAIGLKGGLKLSRQSVVIGLRLLRQARKLPIASVS